MITIIECLIVIVLLFSIIPAIICVIYVTCRNYKNNKPSTWKELEEAEKSGKFIEIRYKGPNKDIPRKWYDCFGKPTSNLTAIIESFDKDCFEYRVKPMCKKKYRPYSPEELAKEFKKHDGFILGKHDPSTYGEREYGNLIVSINVADVIIINSGGEILYIPYEDLSKYYLWSDDNTYCGKEIKEK